MVLVVDGYVFGHGSTGTYECTELPGGSTYVGFGLNGGPTAVVMTFSLFETV